MADLALSSTADVAHYLGIDDAENYEDDADLRVALAVGREQITAMVLPAADLPDPLPESLHRAATVRAAEVFADRQARYGYQQQDDEPAGPVPARFIIRDLIGPWARAKGGKGPDPRRQQW